MAIGAWRDAFLEVRSIGEDFGDATCRVVVPSGLGGSYVTAAVGDTVTVRCVDTTVFPVGHWDLEVWVDWPDGDVFVRGFGSFSSFCC
ncbi:hypothetical protein P7F88_25610 [Vibrio hannami]|uniref:hypothetical protein n=1 Tax=Vibrio hannami TaxID=2717094 RepID=UPI00240F8203|nr:hypothetical protein [Vibrio hannami]MDG3089244.1 hypothetical protein [Vibrio hannami]